jgi:hypothetical protein
MSKMLLSLDSHTDAHAADFDDDDDADADDVDNADDVDAAC